MTPLEWKEIEQELENTPTPEPPEDLLAKIQAEIPSADELAGTPPPRRPAHRQPWLMAASVMIALSAGWLAYRVRDEPKTSGATISRTEIAAQAESSVAAQAATAREEAQQQLSAIRQGQRRRDANDASNPAPLPEISAITAESETDERASLERIERALREKEQIHAVDKTPDAPLVETPPYAMRKAKKPSASSPAAPKDTHLPQQLRDQLSSLSYLGSDEGAGKLEEPIRVSAAPMSTAAPSTGGTAEPNDAPYGDVFFNGYGTNPFVDTEDDNLSTFGLDVDTGSYPVARRYLSDGNLPPREAIRVEEFLNYFDYRDTPPRRGDFALAAEAAPSPFASGARQHIVRFGVQGREILDENRKPATLVFVVDVSGSMARENRLGLVKKSLGMLVDELRSDDEVGLVIYGSEARVLLEPTRNHERIRDAIDGLRSGGSTNAEDGLVTAYRLLNDHRHGAFSDEETNDRRSRRLSSLPKRDRIYRVILCSDGVANVGRTGPESILERIEKEAERGIEITTVGVGMGNYNDVLMEQLANRGDGAYAYVDNLHEAERVFVENLTGTLQTIASDAKIQVEFNPEVVSRYRLLGYENRDIADEDFRNDAVDAGEIGAGHTVTALYEIKLHKDAPKRSEVAKLNLRWKSKESGQVEEISTPLHHRDLQDRWDRAPESLQLASIVAEFAERLKGTYWSQQPKDEPGFRDLLAKAQKVSAEFAGDPDVAELVALIAKADRLDARSRR